jgi:hypothetical protein
MKCMMNLRIFNINIMITSKHDDFKLNSVKTFEEMSFVLIKGTKLYFKSPTAERINLSATAGIYLVMSPVWMSKPRRRYDIVDITDVQAYNIPCLLSDNKHENTFT